MIIAEKYKNGIKFKEFYNPNNKEKIKENECIVEDKDFIFIVCDGEKIIIRGHFTEKEIQEYIQRGYSVFENEEFEWIEGETKHTQYNNNGKAELKTTEMLLVEEKEKKKNEILNLTPKEQAELTLNLNSEKESLELKLKDIDDADTINKVKSITK